MNIHLPSKHTASDKTIFTIMSALAQEHSAINLSQGFPDFQIDPVLSELVASASNQGYNQYAPTIGLAMLRASIAQDFKQRYDLSIDPDDEITITPGATYAIYTAFCSLLAPGDEVIVLEPAYDSYTPNIEMNGAKAIGVKLLPDSFAPDWPAIEAAISPRSKAIIINTPHNPTGTIWSKEDWDQLAQLIRPTNIYVISDEVYEQLVYDGLKHHSILQNAELRARSFAIYSFGKAFHNTGWKVGYCIAPKSMSQAFRRLHQFIAFSVNTPAQHALAHYILHEKNIAANILLEQKRDYFRQAMKQTNFELLKPSLGSYFQLASYASISDLPDTEFATLLTKEYGVAAIPVSAFYSDRYDAKLLRFCFAKEEQTLDAAILRLQSVPNSNRSTGIL